MTKDTTEGYHGSTPEGSFSYVSELSNTNPVLSFANYPGGSSESKWYVPSHVRSSFPAATALSTSCGATMSLDP